MTLEQLKQTIEVSTTGFKNIDRKRLLCVIAKDYLNCIGKNLEQYGISAQQYSAYYYQAEALLCKNDGFKLAHDLVVRKIKANVNIDDTYNTFKEVRKFREAFGLKIKEKPSLLTKSEYDLHFKLLKEELDEYFDACEKGDKVEVFDALVDLRYVLDGAILNHGMEKCFYDGFEEVQQSNMSKLENGKPLYREDGKVMKGKDYFPPNLKSIIDDYS